MAWAYKVRFVLNESFDGLVFNYSRFFINLKLFKIFVTLQNLLWESRETSSVFILLSSEVK